MRQQRLCLRLRLGRGRHLKKVSKSVLIVNTHTLLLLILELIQLNSINHLTNVDFSASNLTLVLGAQVEWDIQLFIELRLLLL